VDQRRDGAIFLTRDTHVDATDVRYFLFFIPIFPTQSSMLQFAIIIVPADRPEL
jgi:hypothetical protein